MRELLGAQNHEVGRGLYLLAMTYQTLELYPEAKQFIGDAVEILQLPPRQGHYLTERTHRVSNASKATIEGD